MKEPICETDTLIGNPELIRTALQDLLRTPPVQHLWAMREALDMLFEEGPENVWERHRR